MHPLDSQDVTVDPEADDDARGDRRDVGVVPVSLARVHVRDVDLDDGDTGSLDRIVQADRGVRESAGIEYDAPAPWIQSMSSPS